MKFCGFDVIQTEEGVRISFCVQNIKGSGLIVEAFNAGKDLVEGSIGEGLLGIVHIATAIYGWIKAGKKA